MLELIRNCSRPRKPVVETRGKPDKADVDFLLRYSPHLSSMLFASRIRRCLLAVSRWPLHMTELEAPRPAAWILARYQQQRRPPQTAADAVVFVKVSRRRKKSEMSASWWPNGVGSSESSWRILSWQIKESRYCKMQSKTSDSGRNW